MLIVTFTSTHCQELMKAVGMLGRSLNMCVAAAVVQTTPEFFSFFLVL
jgi:hypothetical protein